MYPLVGYNFNFIANYTWVLLFYEIYAYKEVETPFNEAFSNIIGTKLSFKKKITKKIRKRVLCLQTN